MTASAEEQPIGEFQMMVTAYRCHCGYVWTARKLDAPERPKTCPSCKTPNWDVPKRWERAKKKKSEESAASV